MDDETAQNCASDVDFDLFGDYTGPKVRPDTVVPARPRYRFQGRITADGSSGFKAEPGRYHLYVSWSCPFAQRSAIVRQLKGLENVISLSAVDPIRDGRGWAFREGLGHDLDSTNNFAFLSEAYEATESGYDGLVTVPVLWDRATNQIVSNNFPDITIDLNNEFNEWATTSVDLYPESLRAEIDSLNDWISEEINGAVYGVGSSSTQAEFDQSVQEIFEALDTLESRLAKSQFLFGKQLTESDVRLWVSLVRFDAVHYGLYKTNLRQLTEYPNLWRYARQLYQIPAFGETTNFDHIKRHYYMTQPRLNPSRLVPPGPLTNWKM